MVESKGLQKIDVKAILGAKNPGLAKKIPGFIVNYLKKIVHQDEINDILMKFGHLHDAHFIEAALNYFGVRYHVDGIEQIPAEGRYIFASNHPLGGLDGMVLILEMSKHYRNIKFPVNDILLNIKNLSGIFLPVNKHGRQGREAAVQIGEAYASDCQILYFPAGLCSRKQKGGIRDLKWQKNFIRQAVAYRRDIVPVHFSGENSNFFYNLSRIRNFLGIKANIEMLYLVDEMFGQKEKQLSVIFGKPLPWQTFDRSKTAVEWAEWVKNISYNLAVR